MTEVSLGSQARARDQILKRWAAGAFLTAFYWENHYRPRLRCKSNDMDGTAKKGSSSGTPYTAREIPVLSFWKSTGRWRVI